MTEATKATVVGHVPACWVIKPLQEVSDFITKGGTPTTYGFDWAGESDGIPFFRSECVTDEGFNAKGMNFIPVAAHRQMSRSEIKPGDLLMTITGNVGRVARASTRFPKANINQHIARIRVFSGLGVDADYVCQCLKHEGYANYYRSILTGLAYPQISLKQVRETPIALPSIHEQKKIAAILATVDDKLRVITHQIEATHTLKQGLMQALFTRGVGTAGAHGALVPNAKSKMMLPMTVPTTWHVRRLGEIAPLIRRPVEIHNDRTYPELGLRSYGKGTFHKPALLGAQVGNKRLFEIKAGDLLFSNVFAWEGAVAVAKPEDDGRYGSHRYISCAVDKTQADTSYLLRYLTTPAGIAALELASPGGAGRNKTLGLTALANIHVPLPPLAEQQKISQILDCIDAKLAVISSRLSVVQKIKRGLMQKLLTGEWQVKFEISADDKNAP